MKVVLGDEGEKPARKKGKVMWYVLWVETGKEHKVRGMLDVMLPADAFERIVIPEKKIQKKIKGQWQEIQRVLFPGYLFVVAEDITDFAKALKAVPEFTQMLKADDAIAAIYPEEEAALKRLVDADEIVEMSQGIIEHDEVKILSGPLKGMEGIVKRINRHKRTAVIELGLFDRVLQVEVGLEITEKRS